MKFNLKQLTAPGARWAIVCATREAVGPWNCPENLDETQRLRAILSGRAVELSGRYMGVDQGPSFLIPGCKFPEAFRLCREFGQESFLSHRGLIYPGPTGRPCSKLFPIQSVLTGGFALTQDNYSVDPESGLAFSFVLDTVSAI